MNKEIKQQNKNKVLVEREVFTNVSTEADFILNNCECKEKPYSIDDIENFYFFDRDELIYSLIEEIKSLDDEDFKECIKEINEDLFHNKNDTDDTLKKTEDYLNSLDNEELKEILDNSYFSHLDISDYDKPQEIYEYWKVSSWLIDKLAEEGEAVIKDFNIWCRTTTGQGIILDSVITKIQKKTKYAEK